MHRHLRCAAVVLGLVSFTAVAPTPPAAARERDQPPARTATRKVTPVYPEIARKAHLEGTVKLSVVVTREGKVKSVAVTGGHPVFAVAASDAAKQWQFAPAARESTEPLAFAFKSPEK
jgi:TonB family protein